jgi:hypothetical protein
MPEVRLATWSAPRTWNSLGDRILRTHPMGDQCKEESAIVPEPTRQRGGRRVSCDTICWPSEDIPIAFMHYCRVASGSATGTPLVNLQRYRGLARQTCPRPIAYFKALADELGMPYHNR